MKSMEFYRNFSIISFLTSTMFAVTAAYLSDFYPALKAFHSLFVIKAIASSIFWIYVTIQWFERKD